MPSSVATNTLDTPPSIAAARRSATKDLPARLLRGAGIACFAVLALGQSLFAFYLVMFYGRAALGGRFADWNKVLPDGYVPGATVRNTLLGLHLAFAVVIIVGGTVQLLPQIRRHWPWLHRWNGRVYLLAAFVLSAGGIVLVWSHGRGDPVQHVAITLNALLILVCGGYALREALARRFDTHRRWVLRLYLAVAGVWFFRVGLMFWIIVNRGPVGFDPTTFRGPALIVLAFAQYLVPLALLELYFHVKARPAVAPRVAMTAMLAVLTGALVVGIAAAWMALWRPHVA